MKLKWERKLISLNRTIQPHIPLTNDEVIYGKVYVLKNRANTWFLSFYSSSTFASILKLSFFFGALFFHSALNTVNRVLKAIKICEGLCTKCLAVIFIVYTRHIKLWSKPTREKLAMAILLISGSPWTWTFKKPRQFLKASCLKSKLSS